MKKESLSRRELIKKSIAGTAIIAGAGLVACSKSDKIITESTEAAAPTDTADVSAVEYVSESDQIAQGVKYKEAASEVSESIRVAKGDTPGSEQYCKNCALNVVKEGEEGIGCQLFPGKQVKPEAWCVSWALKG